MTSLLMGPHLENNTGLRQHQKLTSDDSAAYNQAESAESWQYYYAKKARTSTSHDDLDGIAMLPEHVKSEADHAKELSRRR